MLEACDGSRRIVGGRGTASAAYPGFMMVVVDLSRSPRVLVHTLLHELGHLELAEHPRYPSGGDEDARTMRDVVSVVDEEIEAWERGWTIAQRLGLGIDRRAFERTRLRSLKSYLKWAGRRALGTPTVVVSLVRACTPSGRPSRARR